jgi:chlorite dismutase
LAERLLNLYAGYVYTEAFWALAESERCDVRSKIAREAPQAADATHLYTVFPARSDMDIFTWSAWGADDGSVAQKAFGTYAGISDGWRRFVRPVQTLWGFTRQSTYSRAKSEQDMDPLEGPRTPYLIVYPFSKTKEWYLMSMDARQGMMNEHIKLGKQFFDIKQLLLYSFGLQDQQFVVSYETSDLSRFSELVNQLRDTEGRRYTLLDTPIITGMYRTPEEFVR